MLANFMAGLNDRRVLFYNAGLNIDEGTASYYLDLARGDMKQAFIMYKEDLAWETENPKGMLPLQERVPI